MERTQECSDTLQNMYAVDDRGGYSEFAQEISKAVSMLSSVEWEDLRKEKFFLTPRALYDELARTADSLNSRMAAEDTRRQQWLAAAEVPDEDRQNPVVGGTTDKYGIDLEEFKMKTGRKPKGWKTVVNISDWMQCWWWVGW